MYVGGVVLLRNFPFVGEVRLAVLTRFRDVDVCGRCGVIDVDVCGRCCVIKSNLPHKGGIPQ